MDVSYEYGRPRPVLLEARYAGFLFSKRPFRRRLSRLEFSRLELVFEVLDGDVLAELLELVLSVIGSSRLGLLDNLLVLLATALVQEEVGLVDRYFLLGEGHLHNALVDLRFFI